MASTTTPPPPPPSPVSPGHASPGHASPGHASAARPQAGGGRAAISTGWLATRRGSSTPQLLRLAMVALVLASLGWGAVGAWTAGQHASAAADVVHVSEPLSFEAQRLYQSLSDADVTATTAFLSGPQESLAMRQHYEADIAQAAADLSDLTAAAPAGNSQLRSSLAAVATSLPVYTGYVTQAQADDVLGYQLTGGSFMQVASEQMHLSLLPAARNVYAQTNASLAARSAQATGAPWIVITLVLSVALWILLYRLQRWLSGRTQRSVNYGLIAASIALTVTAIWLAAAFAAARSDLGSAETHGSTPAQALAQATIAVQQARGDEILNLISRSGSTSFQGDFAAARRQAGPGSGSFLTAAGNASPGSAAARSIAAADADARSWYATGAQVFGFDVAANYAAETSLVIGSGPASAAAGFTRLESNLAAAISADQAVFRSGAAAGANALSGPEVAFIVAAVLMAAGCAWGLAQRLSEYR